MSPKKAYQVLRDHQEWRRGGDGLASEPITLGQAIDAALSVLKIAIDNPNGSACVASMKDLKKAASTLGRKGGKTTGQTKARTPEQARKAGLASAEARKLRRQGK